MVYGIVLIITFGDALVNISHTMKLINTYTKQNIPFEYHMFQKGVHGLSLAKPVVANGKAKLNDERAARWFEMSVEWLRIIFGSIPIKD